MSFLLSSAEVTVTRRIRILAATSVLLRFMLCSVWAQTELASNDVSRLRVYGIAERFRWEESVDGQRVVKENGPLFGIGADLSIPLTTPFTLLARGNMLLGEVDYNGGIQYEDGTSEPFDSRTTYSALQGDVALGYTIRSSARTRLTPFAGIGLRLWDRKLDTRFGDDHIGPHGYEEFWVTAYGALGLTGNLAIDDRHSCFVATALHVPIVNAVYSDLSDYGNSDDVELDPGRRLGWRVETGFTASHVTCSLFGEVDRFGQSPESGGFFQPKSTGHTIGIQVGGAFW